MRRALLAAFSLFCLAGAPAAQTSPLQDRLVRSRAVEAVIWGMPVVNYELMRQEMLTKTKAKVGEVVYWGRALDWMNQTLTPNPDTIYFMTFFDTHAGPVVIDVPPADQSGSLNVNMVTIWQMPLEDAGLLGVDKGAGGKFVILPPGHTAAPPTGYTPLQSDTYEGYALIRSNMNSHSDADVAKSIAYGKKIKIYPLAAAANPPPTVFTDAQDILFDSTIRFDSTYFENLNRVIQRDTWLERDRAMIDTLRTLGIEKGKPYKPDAHLRVILDEAAVDAKAWLDARYEAGWETFYPGTNWRPGGVPELAKAMSARYAELESYPLDWRGMIYTLGFIGIKRLGVGQFYLLTPKSKDGQTLDGGNAYKLTVPPNVPIDQYWSVTVYDRQTHALVRNMSRASRASNSTDVKKNPDGSIDIYFGPKAPVGKESNWVPTDPEREFELMFRAYGPKKEFFEKQWSLPDVEKVAAQ